MKPHLCNCEYCEKRTSCLVCGSKEHLHRSHLIPRSLIECILEKTTELEDWLSFEGDNVFTLCQNHHRQFDSFKLPMKDSDKIKYHLERKFREFVDFIQDKHVKTAGRIRFDRWAKKTNDWMFGGGEVLSFKYEQTN